MEWVPKKKVENSIGSRSYGFFQLSTRVLRLLLLFTCYSWLLPFRSSKRPFISILHDSYRTSWFINSHINWLIISKNFEELILTFKDSRQQSVIYSNNKFVENKLMLINYFLWPWSQSAQYPNGISSHPFVLIRSDSSRNAIKDFPLLSTFQCDRLKILPTFNVYNKIFVCIIGLRILAIPFAVSILYLSDHILNPTFNST